MTRLIAMIGVTVAFVALTPWAAEAQERVKAFDRLDSPRIEVPDDPGGASAMRQLCPENIEPATCGPYWAYTGYFVRNATIPARDRELLILRTAWLNRGDYIWGRHNIIGQEAGLTEQEISRVMEGPDATGWSDFDATLLRAADELFTSRFISDPTWNALADRYPESQLREVVLIVGNYTQLSMFQNTLGAQLEPGIPGLPESDSRVDAAQDCTPDGDVEFLCGPVSPEDLIGVPDTPWVIVSGMEDGGFLYAADTRDLSSSVLFPAASSTPRHDRAVFGACPGPVTGNFRPHGVSLRAGANGVHTLYVVGHGEREAIEVFELDVTTEAPTLTWIGCAVGPEGVGFNSVTALPGGGFAATNFARPVGEVWEWEPAGGWSKVPGTETNGPNGLVSSRDGQWLYIGGWGTQSLIRVSRGRTPVQTDEVPVGHHIDNVRWAPDGTLLAAGHLGDAPEAIFQCLREGACAGVTSRVTKVDPDALSAQEIFRYPSNDRFILGTAAIQVGDELWVGGIAGSDHIARAPVP